MTHEQDGIVEVGSTEGLTPVFNLPAHVEEWDCEKNRFTKCYSRVFHRDHPGRIVAIFYGKNHMADSQAYCDWCQERDSKPTNPKPTRISG